MSDALIRPSTAPPARRPPLPPSDSPTSRPSTAPRSSPTLTVLDVDPDSAGYGRVVGWVDSPELGDEFHHFGWNACSSALMHEGHDMSDLARRFLLVPGIRSSNIYVFDTAADPRQPTLHKTIPATALAEKAGYSRPHTLHCGPDGCS